MSVHEAHAWNRASSLVGDKAEEFLKLQFSFSQIVLKMALRCDILAILHYNEMLQGGGEGRGREGERETKF